MLPGDSSSIERKPFINPSGRKRYQGCDGAGPRDLSGRVSSTSNLSQVLAISESFYPKKVINLLEVSGVLR
jgi:hypothetical protein